MKIASRFVLLLILVTILGCKKDDDNSETVEKKQLDKLVADWTLQSANDGNDRTMDFFTDEPEPKPLVLHIQGNYVEGGTYNYSFTGTRPNPSPWPESGTWKFGTDKSKDIIRDPNTPDEIPISYTVTDTELIISFTVPDGSAGWPGTSRTKNVVGLWTFTFSK